MTGRDESTKNLVRGVKFPTGDASRLDNEVAQAKLFQSFLPPGAPHDPLGHSIASVHPHMLALGSGSYDGEHFSANAGVDVPLRIANNGFQSVADYEVRGGFSWRF